MGSVRGLFLHPGSVGGRGFFLPFGLEVSTVVLGLKVGVGCNVAGMPSWRGVGSIVEHLWVAGPMRSIVSCPMESYLVTGSLEGPS